MLKKRCGVGNEYDNLLGIDDNVLDPYDNYHAFVKVNDYTKNISEPLFSSGLLKPDFSNDLLWKGRNNPFY